MDLNQKTGQSPDQNPEQSAKQTAMEEASAKAESSAMEKIKSFIEKRDRQNGDADQDDSPAGESGSKSGSESGKKEKEDGGKPDSEEAGNKKDNPGGSAADEGRKDEGGKPSPEKKEDAPSDDSGKKGDANAARKLEDLFSGLDLKAFEADDGALTVEQWKSFFTDVVEMRNQLVEMSKAFADIRKFADSERASRLDAEIDEAFDGLGEEFAEIFGRGSARTIDKALLKNRDDVLAEASVLAEGYRATGREFTIADVIRKAAILKQTELFKNRPKPSERKESFIARPQSSGQEEHGDEGALRLIRNWNKQHNGG